MRICSVVREEWGKIKIDYINKMIESLEGKNTLWGPLVQMGHAARGISGSIKSCVGN